MSQSEPRRSRTGSALTRILLITVLLLGFGSMHTLGHVQHGAHASSGAHSSGAHSAGAHSAGSTYSTGAYSAAPESALSLPELDPTSVCPTLGAFVAVLLGVAPGAFLRWPGTPADTAGPALFPVRPPFPAPDEPSLSRLQVLRV
ncbi:DUF6153 family protein [Nocardiopsis metallicus]|uniref:Uncharacterized protein n=1 Tax=Nocardiopsis metallicus TaxID=179819 RepID=A0A840W8K0_9ACTN|nr:DUF6153 family protein [Nocardiopsis metallicus]MBB5492382.1 hypothetical protein [Nocardiopsis metallicus]